MPLQHRTPRHMFQISPRNTMRRAGLWVSAISILAGCTSKPSPPPPQAPTPAPAVSGPGTSAATTPRDYRRDAATHLYAKYNARVFNGKLPPQLYAVGVLQVDINAQGAVTGLRWMRAPSHAPEVVAEIERHVREAEPFPAPVRLGRVTYIDTWLWDKSGRFQLDTLTEGQL
jgi:protein TonB